MIDIQSDTMYLPHLVDKNAEDLDYILCVKDNECNGNFLLESMSSKIGMMFLAENHLNL